MGPASSTITTEGDNNQTDDWAKDFSLTKGEFVAPQVIHSKDSKVDLSGTYHLKQNSDYP